MSWRHLWLRMMGRDLRRTVAFVVPTALAVMLFLLFRSLVGTAGIEASPFRPESVIDAAFAFTSYLVAFFSGFFVVYFHRLYVRGESQALGLLATFGLSPRDRRNLIRLESAALGAASLALGTAAAYLLGPLFARFTAVLFDFGVDFAFRVPPRALAETGAFFGAVFLVEALYTSRWAARRWPREFFSAVWQVEAVPKPSAKWGLLGLLSLFGGYGLAVYVHPWVMAYTEYAYAVYADAAMKWFLLWVFLALIIVALVLGGTYLVLRDTLRLWVEGRRRRMTEGRGGVSSASLFLLARLGAELRRFAGVSAVFAGVFAAFFTTVAAISFINEFDRLRAVELYPVPVQAAFVLDSPLSRASGELNPGSPAPAETPAADETGGAFSDEDAKTPAGFPGLSEGAKIVEGEATRVASRLAEEGIVVAQRIPFQVARLEMVPRSSASTPPGEVPEDRREAVLHHVRENLRSVEVLSRSTYVALRDAQVAHRAAVSSGVEPLPEVPPLAGRQAFFLAHGMDASTFSRFARSAGGLGFPFEPGEYELLPGWGSPSAPPPPFSDPVREPESRKREGLEESVAIDLVGATGTRGHILNPAFTVQMHPDATLVVADELWARLPREALFAHGELAVGEAMWVAESSLPRLHRLAADRGLSGFGGSRGFASHGGAGVETSVRNVWFTVQSDAVENALLRRLSYMYTLTFLGLLLFTFGALALYLRLRESEAKDLREASTLRSLGFRAGEVRQIWRREALALYLLPLVFASLHLAFAAVDAGGILPRASGWFASALAVLEGVRPPSLAESLRMIPPRVVYDLVGLVAGSLLLFVLYALLAGNTYGQELWRRVVHRRR